MNGNRLSGSIPEGLGYLPQLRELYLNSNELDGCIPSSFSMLTNLEGLNVSWNHLSGGFPACLGGMTSLKLLVLEGNDELQDQPPAEHGTELLQWLSSKRSAYARLSRRVLALNSGLEGRQNGPVQRKGRPSNGLSAILQEDERKTSSVGNRLPGDLDVEEFQLSTRHLKAEVHPSLQEVLQDEAGPPFNLEAFRSFTATQLMEENVEFLLEVNQFKIADSACLQHVGAALCSRFVTAGAPMEVNLSGAVRATTVANVGCVPHHSSFPQKPRMTEPGPLARVTLSRNVFDQAERQIYDLLDADAFPRFLQSAHA